MTGLPTPLAPVGVDGRATTRTLLVEQARHERDRRAASYPAKIARLAPVGLGGPGNQESAMAIEQMCTDYQCWVAIAEWLETDRFYSFAGGADPDSPNPPIISWPELEAAAERATVSVKGDNPDSLLRRARLTTIHRLVQLRRESIDAINGELRKPKALAA